MTNQTGNNVIEFPAEYLMEQRQQDRWLTIASCSIVMGSDEPMAYVDMILDKFGDGPSRSPADIIAHARFSARTPPGGLVEPEGEHGAASAAAELGLSENVFNEWIDAWLPVHPC